MHIWYRTKLDQAITDMQRSLVFWLKAEYIGTGLAAQNANDAAPAVELTRLLKKMANRWQSIFDKFAVSLAPRFVDRSLRHSDNALQSSLNAAGMKVKFTMTPGMTDAYAATLTENVGLIKSIASEHLSDVEGLVMRSVQRGRDLASLTNELTVRYDITRRRAALIARDQNNKATSVLQATRQKQLGISKGVWRHSHAGKHPRPSHVRADGETFDLAKGLYLDGEWVMPGELVNCRCGWQPIIPGLEEQ